MNSLVYRPNVGIILLNKSGQVLLAERSGMPDTWQLPQGGIDDNESPLEALYRECKEEIGLVPSQYRVLAVTSGWIYYQVPYWQELAKMNNKFKGQKQKWFLLEFLGKDSDITLDLFDDVEFSNWQWVSYWYPLTKSIDFKLNSYRYALTQLLPAYRNFMIERH